ncbi:MAG: DUF92 domain-containing protein [Nitrososphaerota archaeon]|nr:DUF92 domain-containing protein [Nitrososphaerales archaeon]MDW8045457.1 DUF92 domain-containing protein [Nitrososphaerota archaeon]
MQTILETMVKLGVVVLLAFISYLNNMIDRVGTFVAILIGFSVVLGGGWSWFITLLTFFVVSTQFTRFKYEYKKKIGCAEGDGGRRSWRNIIANGGVAAFIALMEGVSTNDGFERVIYGIAFVGAISTATADTLATEIGLISRSSPRLITNLKRKVPQGTSGGVTLLGEFASIFGSLLIGLVAALLNVANTSVIKVIIISTISGFVGSTIDSILGATVQGLYRCQVCGSLTESIQHHDNPTLLIKGFHHINNHVVNFIATLAGALLSITLFFLI